MVLCRENYMKTAEIMKADVKTMAWLEKSTKQNRNVLMIYFLSFTFQCFLLNNIGAMYLRAVVQI